MLIEGRTVPRILAIFVVTSLSGSSTTAGVELMFGALALVCLLLTVLAVRDVRVLDTQLAPTSIPSREGER
jgi:hypothetical protein